MCLHKPTVYIKQINTYCQTVFCIVDPLINLWMLFIVRILDQIQSCVKEDYCELLVSLSDICMPFFFLGKFLELNKLLCQGRKLKILRLYGRTHERNDFADPFHSIRSMVKPHATNTNTSGDGRCLPEFQQDSLHHKIRTRNPTIKITEKKLLAIVKKDEIPSNAQKKQ